MLFTVVILVAFGAIVFIHYIQGFFSATLSAILAAIAAVIAFSYHESLVPLYGGHAADYASGISLLVLFAVIFIVLRVVFDKAIPGNIRLPVTVDKVGAGVMGIFAAIFATGILAIGAQEMPFGPDIAGFTRFEVNPKRQVLIETKGRQVYSANFDELTATVPGSAGTDEHGVPILPVDNLVVALVDKLSGPSGSLQNGKPLYTVHPDFLGETFDQRLGIEAGGDHTATNLASAGLQSARVGGLFMVNPKVSQTDADSKIRSGGALKDVRPTPSQILLAVRIMFGPLAADKDGVIRFSPGCCRLLLHDPQGDDPDSYQNYFPIGNMEATDKLMLNKLDDFLFCTPGKGADLVYLVPKKLFSDPKKTGEMQAPPGSFVEIKRWARTNLTGMKIEPALIASSDVAVMRKGSAPAGGAPAGIEIAAPAPQGGTAKPSAPAPAVSSGSEFAVDRVSVVDFLPTPLGIPITDRGDTQKVPPGGYVKLDSNHQLKNSVMDAAISELTAAQKIVQFAVPDGQAMVQVSGKVPGSAPWLFATESEQYELVDAQGKHYPPNGIFATYKGANGEHVQLRYIDSTGISGAAAPEGSPPPPSQVVFLFVVPNGTALKEFDDHGKKVYDINLTAKK